MACKISKWFNQVTILIFILPTLTSTSDITSSVFGSEVIVTPAAFGDFNSDEVTDLFVIVDNSVQVLLGTSEGEPLLRKSNLACNFTCPVTSVVPGDFNGDAFLDAVVTIRCKEDFENVYVLWGNLNSLNCTKDPLFISRGQPLALDYNYDFITDLFGEDERGHRVFWVFDENGSFVRTPVNSSCGQLGANPIRNPHSNAFLDLDDDLIPDLFITSGKGDNNQMFEVWTWSSTEKTFTCQKIFRPPNEKVEKMGQSIFLDVELEGKLNHLLPIWTGKESKLFMFVDPKPNITNGLWHDLRLNLTDPTGVTWRWAWDKNEPLLQAITVRSGDFNMDGYPDLLAPLASPSGAMQTILLENTACTNCAGLTRDYKAKWDAFYPNGNDSVAGAFFDIYQDGVMDVILIFKRGDKFSVGAFKNNLDYDANFIKVMVVSGLRSEQVPFVVTPLGKHKRTFGSNVGGPRVWYRTLDQAGRLREGVSTQLSQTAHFALGLPYTTFALGRTPNFVDALSVAYAGRSREWPQIIPNSQMVVIPNPVDNPARWKAQLFVTPSKVILLSAAALIVICIIISMAIAFLHWKERRTDRLERLQGDDRFYFDAM